MRIFFDSSALVKRYIYEHGSDTVLELCRDAEEIILSILCGVEVISALSRRKREGALTKKQYTQIKRSFAADIKGASIVEFYPTVVQEAVRCLENSNIRSLDAIQIASALVAESDLFVTSDDRQGAAAKKRGLGVRLVGG